MPEAPGELVCDHATGSERRAVTAGHFLFACAFPAGAADLPAIAACIWSKFFGLRNRRTWGSGATTSKEQLRIQNHLGTQAVLTMDLVMLPAQTLSDAYTPPLLLREQAKSAAVIGIEEILGDHLEKRLGEDDVTIFVFFIRIALRVVNPAEMYK